MRHVVQQVHGRAESYINADLSSLMQAEWYILMDRWGEPIPFRVAWFQTHRLLDHMSGNVHNKRVLQNPLFTTFNVGFLPWSKNVTLLIIINMIYMKKLPFTFDHGQHWFCNLFLVLGTGMHCLLSNNYILHFSKIWSFQNFMFPGTLRTWAKNRFDSCATLVGQWGTFLHSTFTLTSSVFWTWKSQKLHVSKDIEHGLSYPCY